MNNIQYGFNSSQCNTPEQKKLIRLTRKAKLLSFIANNHWASTRNLFKLLAINDYSYTLKLANELVEDGKLVITKVVANGKQNNVYTITEWGAFVIGAEYKRYQVRFSYQSFIHNETVQSLQITAIKKGFEWVNERSIIATKSFKSLPDGLLVVVPNSHVISVEYQRNRLNVQTLKAKIAKCLADIINKKFKSVLYVCSDNVNAQLMQRAFDSVKFIKTKTDADIEFNDGYRAKFKCINLHEFADYITTLQIKQEV